MSSQEDEPKLGAESFSCPHCNAVAHHDWFSLFLKPENATDVVVLIPENVTVSMLVQGESERDDIKEADQFVERLRKNELTYVYQKHSQSIKVKMANLSTSIRAGSPSGNSYPCRCIWGLYQLEALN